MVAPAFAASIVAGMMLTDSSARRGGEIGECALDRPGIACGLPALERRATLTLNLRVRGEDAAVGAGGQRGVLGLGEAVLADHLDLLALDPRDPLAVRLDQARLHVGDRLDRSALLGDHDHLLAGALGKLGDQAVHHLRALEDVGVLEQVGLEREHLLDPQAPLLVPGPRQAKRLVPGGELNRAGAGVAPQRHRERFQHDPLDVVLGLGLGQAEAVDLDAVAHPQELRLGDPIALASDLLPQLRHRAQLRVLLDEAHAGVDEERDPAEDLREVRLGDLTAGLDLVEHGDRGRQRVGDLLHRGRARPPAGDSCRRWSGSSSGSR